MADLPQDVALERPTSRVAVVSFTGEHDLATRDETRDLLSRLVDENRLVVTDFSKAESYLTAAMPAAGTASAMRKAARMMNLRVTSPFGVCRQSTVIAWSPPACPVLASPR
jgi:hypothetical protein